MARARTPIGEIGKIGWTKENGQWVGRANTRLPNGKGYKPIGRGKTKAEAEADLREKVRKRVEGVSESLGHDPSLSTLIDLWLNTDFKAANYTDPTRVMYRLHADCIRKYAGDLRASELTLDRLQSVLFREGLPMPSQMRQRKVVLKHIMVTAMKHKVLTANPASDIAVPRHDSTLVDEDGEPLAYTEADVRKLLSIARQFDAAGRAASGPRRNLRTYPFLAVAFGAGLRTGELIGLQWRDYDPAAGTLHIRRSVTYPAGGARVIKGPKTKSGIRVLTLPGWVRKALDEYFQTLDGRKREKRTPVFPSRDGDYIQGSSIRRTLKSMVEGTQFEGDQRLLQVARHTTGTMIARKIGGEAAGAHLGHSKTSTTFTHYVNRRRARGDFTAALDDLDPMNEDWVEVTDEDEDDWA